MDAQMWYAMGDRTGGRRTGRAACEIWLEEHRGQLGRRATVEIERRYLAPYAQPGVPA